MRYHFLENNGRALKFIKDEGLHLVGIGPEGTSTPSLPPNIFLSTRRFLLNELTPDSQMSSTARSSSFSVSFGPSSSATRST